MSSRLAHAAERGVGHHGVEDLLGHRLQDLGGDEAGRHRVDADLVLGQLPRPGLGHADHARPWWPRSWSGRSCRRGRPPSWCSGSTPPPPAIMCGTTARVQLKTPLRLTPITASHWLVAHGGDHLAVLELHQLGVAHDAGVVHQHVDAAPVRRPARRPRPPPRRTSATFTFWKRPWPPAPSISATTAGGVGVVDVPGRHPAALLGEAQRRRPADAGGGAGDDHHLVLQSRLDHPALLQNPRGAFAPGNRSQTLRSLSFNV